MLIGFRSDSKTVMFWGRPFRWRGTCQKSPHVAASFTTSLWSSLFLLVRFPFLIISVWYFIHLCFLFHIITCRLQFSNKFCEKSYLVSFMMMYISRNPILSQRRIALLVPLKIHKVKVELSNKTGKKRGRTPLSRKWPIRSSRASAQSRRIRHKS